MQFSLVVVRPFEKFKRGDVVEQEAEVAAILAGAHALDVVRISAPQTDNVGKGG